MKNRFKNAQAAFEFYYDKIINNGVDYNKTKTIFNESFIIENPLDNEIKTTWRKWKRDYAEREWDWYLSENRSVEELKKHAKIWDLMHNGDNIVNSNYGYLWNENKQIDKMVNILINDNFSRRAVITLYDGKNVDDYNFDTPCTLNVAFHILDNRLNMSVYMRSNDLIYGFCNDQYCFSKLQNLVLEKYNNQSLNKLEIGEYYHSVMNLHIYEKHFNLKK